MRVLIIILLSLPSMVLAETFIDQVDGDVALVCSNDSKDWVCKPVPCDTISQLGYVNAEGLVLAERTK